MDQEYRKFIYDTVERHGMLQCSFVHKLHHDTVVGICMIGENGSILILNNNYVNVPMKARHVQFGFKKAYETSDRFSQARVYNGYCSEFKLLAYDQSL